MVIQWIVLFIFAFDEYKYFFALSHPYFKALNCILVFIICANFLLSKLNSFTAFTKSPLLVSVLFQIKKPIHQKLSVFMDRIFQYSLILSMLYLQFQLSWRVNGCCIVYLENEPGQSSKIQPWKYKDDTAGCCPGKVFTFRSTNLCSVTPVFI